jgi:purine nucleosidase
MPRTSLPRTFLIDTDTASDDAVALIMALRSPGVHVAAITTVAGNVRLEQAARNALYVADLCASHVPVFMGAERPLWRQYIHAEWFHGRDGLGGHGYPAPTRLPEKAHAVEAIITTIRANPGLTVVTLGPLTNLALALAQAPDIAANVGRCIVMGGNPCCEGNVTPAAEYNIWVDPEAARIVFRSALPLEMAGWHLSRGEAALNGQDIKHVLNLNTPLATFAIECNSTAMEAYSCQTSETGISLPDPVAMAIAIDPTIVTEATDQFVDIEIASDLTRGMTVVDRLNVSADDRNRDVWRAVPRKTNISWSIDNNRWKQLLYRTLA